MLDTAADFLLLSMILSLLILVPRCCYLCRLDMFVCSSVKLLLVTLFACVPLRRSCPWEERAVFPWRWSICPSVMNRLYSR
ncbi:hypothetical protein DFH11DRAFT_1619339 [Phellopilus nigrolimitatus]|nr:hypothetical protein DFH11DRAFT_1619339 [Phellopilus nigrolimitatus]